jgi:NAD-dependent dihydropyrimidine dehydrogenase PreA subunit
MVISMYDAYSVNTLQYDQNLCNGCGMCVNVCPHAVFKMNGRKAFLVKPLACMECGACQLNCITNAISVESGVGCAAAMIRAALLGKPESECSC